MRVDKSNDGISYKIKTLDAIKVSISFKLKPQNQSEFNSDLNLIIVGSIRTINNQLHVN